MSIYQEWLDAKKAEKEAVATRRELEDQMIADFKISEGEEGTTTIENDGFKVKVVSRMSRKVDGDKVQEIAAENGLSDYLPTLFRWKPDINMSAWKNTDKSITDVLLDGVTTTPGRPSFTITKE